MTTGVRRTGAAKAGDVLKPAGYYRFVPLGVLSLAIWAVQIISLFFIVTILIEGHHHKVTATFHGDGLRIWLLYGFVWFGLLTFNLGIGSLIARRRFELKPHGVVIHGALGGQRIVSRHGVVQVTTVRSISAMMQGVIHLRYADGSKANIEAAGLNGEALGRLSAWMAKAKPTARA